MGLGFGITSNFAQKSILFILETKILNKTTGGKKNKIVILHLFHNDCTQITSMNKFFRLGPFEVYFRQTLLIIERAIHIRFVC